MTPTGLVVADDLTGASDTGHEFAARGCHTLVSTRGGRGSERTDVRVVDTDSRYEPPEVAATAVRDAIDGGEYAFVYKKVDSTLRGDLVSEVDAALDATGADLALVAPAAPRNGRTTAEGFHLVDGRLVTDTDAGTDPDKPVETAHLPTRFAGSASRVVRLDTECVAAGADSVEAGLTRAAAGETGPTVVVADATHERHLAALAAGAARAACGVLYVGSAGLARYVETAATTAGGPVSVPREDRSVLCVAGSTSPTTREQLRTFPEDALVALGLTAAVSDPEAASAAAAAACAERLASSGLAVLASAPDADAVDRAIRAGRDRGLDGCRAGARRGGRDALGRRPPRVAVPHGRGRRVGRPLTTGGDGRSALGRGRRGGHPAGSRRRRCRRRGPGRHQGRRVRRPGGNT